MNTLPDVMDAARVDALVSVVAQHHGARPAFLFDDGSVLSYLELEQAIDEASAALAVLGVIPGDRVALVGENTIDLLILLFAAVRAGAWAVPLNARLSAGEIDAILAHCTPRLAYFSKASGEAQRHGSRRGARSASASASVLAPGLTALDGTWEVDPDSRAETDPAATPADKVAVMIYTSGSTGKPKGVMLTHRNLCFIANSSARSGAQHADDRIYLVLPISHSYGLTSVLLCGLRAGAAFFPVARFSVAHLVTCIRERGLTVFQGVPAMYARLIEWAQSADPGETQLKPNALRLAYIGGSMIDSSRKLAAEELLGLKLHHGYGLTEAAPTVTRTLGENPPTDTTIGWAFTGLELRILDGAGNLQAATAGAQGELLVRGPNIMKGYYCDPEQTKKAIDAEGWLHTGDQARVGERDELYIVGRLKELIIRGGFNVYPPEVEAAINAFPGVAQSAVVGVADDGDEAIVAYIEPMAGQSVDLKTLEPFLRERLAAYKLPAHIVVRATLPASGTGKLLKAAIRAEAIETFAGPATRAAPTP